MAEIWQIRVVTEESNFRHNLSLARLVPRRHRGISALCSVRPYSRIADAQSEAVLLLCPHIAAGVISQLDSHSCGFTILPDSRRGASEPNRWVTA